MRTICGIAAACLICLMPPAAAQVRDTQGTVLGTANWQAIPLQSSGLTIHGDVSLVQRWEKNELPGRYQERLALNGGSLFYERLHQGGFRESEPRTVKPYLDRRYQLAANGYSVPDTSTKFQANGKLYYLMASRGQTHCFAFLIEGSVRSSQVNAVANGYICRDEPVTPKAELEKFGLDFVTRLDFADEGRTNRARPVMPVAGGRSARPVAVNWEGFAQPVAGSIELDQTSRGGSMKFTLPNGEGICDGKFSTAADGSGTWDTKCTNGLTASGIFRAHGPQQGSTGSGVDSQGRKIEYTLGAAP